MWDHAASLLEFADVLVEFASDVVVYVLKSFRDDLPILIWDVYVWQMRVQIDHPGVSSLFELIVAKEEIRCSQAPVGEVVCLEHSQSFVISWSVDWIPAAKFDGRVSFFSDIDGKDIVGDDS